MLRQSEAGASEFGYLLQLQPQLVLLEARSPSVAGYEFVLAAESPVRTEEVESRLECGYRYLKPATLGGDPDFPAREHPAEPAQLPLYL